MNKQERAELIYKQKHKIINGVEYKKCRQCEEWIPMTREYYLKSNNVKDGFMAICKKCVKQPEKRKPIKMGFNNYEIRDDHAVIFIDNGAGESYEFLVDIKNIPRLKNLDQRWSGRIFYNCDTPYAITNIWLGEYGNKKHTTLLLHRFLMGVTDPEIDVDHEDHDTLNNREYNLRVTEAIHNTKNRKGKNKNNKSGYRNVCWLKSYNQWCVQLMINGKNTRLGFFDDVHEAGKFAEEMREKYYGEFKGEG